MKLHQKNDRLLSLLGACLALLMSGCAALTNPAQNGVPARLVPDELLADPKEALEQIELSWLRAKSPDVYLLDTGDILGVYVEGILPERGQTFPIHFPDTSSVPPGTGVPIVISENGMISLPYLDEIDVRGMSVEEARKAVKLAYTKVKDPDDPDNILLPGQTRILVDLLRPRQTRILVIREDSPTSRLRFDNSFASFRSTNLNQTRGSGIGSVLSLPSIEADVLSVLASSGGLPGPFATNEVIIYRGFNGVDGAELPDDWTPKNLGTGYKLRANIKPETIRIPLLIRPGQERPFNDDAIRLQPDDIVFVPARTLDIYYTGGLLPAREVPLPRDYDLRAVEAVLRIGGSLINGGRFTNNFTGGILSNGIGTPNPSLLTVIRRVPKGGVLNIRVDLNRALTDPQENIVIKEGDLLLLQETPSEAVSRYVSQVFNVNAATQIFSRGSAAATGTVALP